MVVPIEHIDKVGHVAVGETVMKVAGGAAQNPTAVGCD